MVNQIATVICFVVVIVCVLCVFAFFSIHMPVQLVAIFSLRTKCYIFRSLFFMYIHEHICWLIKIYYGDCSVRFYSLCLCVIFLLFFFLLLSSCHFSTIECASWCKPSNNEQHEQKKKNYRENSDIKILNGKSASIMRWLYSLLFFSFVFIYGDLLYIPFFSLHCISHTFCLNKIYNFIFICYLLSSNQFHCKYSFKFLLQWQRWNRKRNKYDCDVNEQSEIELCVNCVLYTYTVIYSNVKHG